MTRLAATRLDINNSVINGDFEYAPPFTAVTTAQQHWIDGTAAGSVSNDVYKWAIATAGGSYAASFDSSNPYADTNSLKLSTTATGSFIEVHCARLDSAAGRIGYAIAVSPSTSYTGKFWMKTNLTSGASSTGALMAFRTYNAALAGVAGPASTGITTTTSWTEYTVTFTTGATVAFVVPVMLIYGHTGTGTLIMDAWFDNIRLGLTTPVTRSSA